MFIWGGEFVEPNEGKGVRVWIITSRIFDVDGRRGVKRFPMERERLA